MPSSSSPGGGSGSGGDGQGVAPDVEDGDSGGEVKLTEYVVTRWWRAPEVREIDGEAREETLGVLEAMAADGVSLWHDLSVPVKAEAAAVRCALAAQAMGR